MVKTGRRGIEIEFQERFKSTGTVPYRTERLVLRSDEKISNRRGDGSGGGDGSSHPQLSAITHCNSSLQAASCTERTL